MATMAVAPEELYLPFDLPSFLRVRMISLSALLKPSKIAFFGNFGKNYDLIIKQ